MEFIVFEICKQISKIPNSYNMDKHIFIKVLHTINEEDDFNNMIDATGITTVELKSEISYILTDRYLNEHRESNPEKKHPVASALFNLLNPKKKYMLTVKVSDDETYVELIGTKDEIIEHLVNDSYDRISDMRIDTPEFQSITKEDVHFYYDSHFRVVKMSIGTNHLNKSFYFWNYQPDCRINFYDMYLLNQLDEDYYFIYDMDDVKMISKSNKNKYK